MTKLLEPKRLSIELMEEKVEQYGFRKSDARHWRAKFSNLKGHAPQRGVACELTFDEYLRLAKKAKLRNPKQIGKSIGKYQLGRIGDVGNYAVGSCRFIKVEANIAERKENGGASAAGAKNAENLSKSFRAISPSGKIYKGKNVAKFCRIHGLNQSYMSKALRGIASHHKGWTGEYL